MIKKDILTLTSTSRWTIWWSIHWLIYCCTSLSSILICVTIFQMITKCGRRGSRLMIYCTLMAWDCWSCYQCEASLMIILVVAEEGGIFTVFWGWVFAPPLVVVFRCWLSSLAEVEVVCWILWWFWLCGCVAVRAVKVITLLLQKIGR